MIAMLITQTRSCANVIYLTRSVPPLPTLLLLRWLWTIVLRWRRVAQVVLWGRIGVERGLRLSAVLHMHCRDRLRVRLGVVLLRVMLRMPRLLLRARRLEVLWGDIGSTWMIVQLLRFDALSGPWRLLGHDLVLLGLLLLLLSLLLLLGLLLLLLVVQG